MSWQATTAVRKYTQFVEDKHFAGFRILLAIADRANAQGVCGVAGEADKCLSVRALADEARVHRNSVSNWLPRLEESGEITIERYGAGRGSHMVYRINIMGDVTLNEEMSQADVTIPQKTSQAPNLMSQAIDVTILEEMSQGIKRIMELMSQGNVTIVTSPSLVGQTVPIEPKNNNNDFDTFLREFERKTGIPPKPERTNDWVEKWQVAIEGMLSRANSLSHALATMETAVDTLWSGDKPYRITSPDSILKTYLNIIGTTKSANGTRGAKRNDDGSYNV